MHSLFAALPSLLLVAALGAFALALALSREFRGLIPGRHHDHLIPATPRVARG